MISGCSNLLMDNCFIEATGEVAGSEIICMTYGASGLGAIIRNTGIIGKTTVASCTNLIGLKCGAAQIMFENCSFNLNAAQTPTGYVAAISNATSPPTAYPRILMKNCNVYVNSGIAATYGIYLTKGEAYITDSLIMTPAAGNSLKQVDPGILQVAGCRYDETTVSGSIIITPSNVDKFNGSEDDVLRLNKATKLLTNKAIQNKSSGIIDYYDDDGETVILTHTPADGESTIERTPS